MNEEEIIITNDIPFYRILNGTSYTYAPIPKEFKPYFERLQQENKILKENAEHNDKVVDKVNWENQLLKKEIHQLKDQLEESEKARKEAIHYIRTELLCFDNESVEYIEGLKILNKLYIDKGE